MIREYLQGLYDAIPFSIDRVVSRAGWRSWRRRTLAALRACLGLEEMPPRTPLRPRVAGVLERDGYVLEKVVFESRPAFLVTGNLYRPAGKRGQEPFSRRKKVPDPFFRVPAILCVHGHTLEGKTSQEMQSRCIAYARAGWVALAIDATGHGERGHIGHRRQFAITTAGLALEGIQVWDNMRAVDYLLSRPEVDPRRIGITGCSGGGNQTMYTAAMDERLAAAVPVCSVSTLRGQIFTPNSIGCDCECVPRLMRYGLENAVVCALIAPRPLLVLAGKRDDTFPIEHTRVAHRHLRRFYAALGWGDRYRYIERPLTHGYHAAFRRLGGEWFARWFEGEAARARYSEAGAELEPPERIWCFPGGQLPESSATLGTVAHAAARKLLRRLRAPRGEAGRRALRVAIRDEVLGGFPARDGLGAKASKPVRRAGVLRWAVALESESGITIRASIARAADANEPCSCLVLVRPAPATTSARRALECGALAPLWLCGEHTRPEEREARAATGRRTPELRTPELAATLGMGWAVAELDVRPLGEDEHASKAAMVLGRPMVGMGVYDITRFLDYIAARADIAPGRVWLWAEGLMALPALFALALDERVAGATLVGLLSTYVSPRPVPHPTWTFAPGLLRHADIDQLVALAAPRPVVIANPVGPDLHPLSSVARAAAFPAARKAFGRSGALRIFAGSGKALLRATRAAAL